MKYLLIPLLLIISAWSVHAEDSWLTIDGIRIRYGVDLPPAELFAVGEYDVAWSNSAINVPPKMRRGGGTVTYYGGTVKFPLTISFSETLLNKWSFRQAYLNFSPTQTTKNIPPVSSVTVSAYLNEGVNNNSDYFYLKQRNDVRTHLKNNFLPKYLSSTQINNLPTNWAISYDIKGSAIMIGYMYGVFWPIRDIQRLFKAGLGVGISRLDNSININLCDSYTVTLNYITEKETRVGLEKYHEGKCNNPNNIVSFSYVEASISIGYHFTLWERVSKDSIWKIISGDVTMNINTPGTGRNNTKFTTILSSTELLSYTYRF